MAKIIECVPNFSEGQNEAVINGLVSVAKSVGGVTLLDHSSDASHNRSVFTLVGDEEGIQEVAFQLVKYDTPITTFFLLYSYNSDFSPNFIPIL